MWEYFNIQKLNSAMWVLIILTSGPSLKTLFCEADRIRSFYALRGKYNCYLLFKSIFII